MVWKYEHGWTVDVVGTWWQKYIAARSIEGNSVSTVIVSNFRSVSQRNIRFIIAEGMLHLPRNKFNAHQAWASWQVRKHMKILGTSSQHIHNFTYFTFPEAKIMKYHEVVFTPIAAKNHVTRWWKQHLIKVDGSAYTILSMWNQTFKHY